MKPIVLISLLALACVEPPSTDKGAGIQPDGAAAPGAPQPEGGSAAPGEATQGGSQAPAEGVPAEGAVPLEGAPAEGAVPLEDGPGAVVPDRGEDAPEGEPIESHPQDEIEDGVSISGVLSCDGCEGSLIVRVEDAGSNPPQLLTSATFESAGSFTIQSPRDKKVVLMVIHDADGSGGPTPGEGIGLWTGGLLNTSTDTTDVELTVGVMPDTPPIEPGVEAEEPAE